MRLVKRFVRIDGGECLQIEGLAMSLSNAIVLLPILPIHDAVAGFICNGNKVRKFSLWPSSKGALFFLASESNEDDGSLFILFSDDWTMEGPSHFPAEIFDVSFVD